MQPRGHIDAVRASGAMLVVDCDVPEGMTLGEWRRKLAADRRAASAGKRRRRGLRRLLRRAD